jgi:hypothetical protein
MLLVFDAKYRTSEMINRYKKKSMSKQSGWGTGRREKRRSKGKGQS